MNGLDTTEGAAGHVVETFCVWRGSHTGRHSGAGVITPIMIVRGNMRHAPARSILLCRIRPREYTLRRVVYVITVMRDIAYEDSAR